MSECQRYEAMISALLDGELSARDEAEVRSHMEHCPDCAAMYEAFAAVSEAIGAEDVPDTLHDGIMAKLRPVEKAHKTQHILIRLRPIMAAAACLVVLVGTLLALNNTVGMRGRSGKTKSAAMADAPMAPAMAPMPDAAVAAGGSSGSTGAADGGPMLFAKSAENAVAEYKAETAGVPEEPKTESAKEAAPGEAVNTSTDGPLAARRVETLCFTMRLDAVTDDGLQGTVTDPDVQPWLAEGDAITVRWDGGTQGLAPGTVWTVTVPAYEPPENGTIRALALDPAQ